MPRCSIAFWLLQLTRIQLRPRAWQACWFAFTTPQCRQCWKGGRSSTGQDIHYKRLQISLYQSERREARFPTAASRTRWQCKPRKCWALDTARERPECALPPERVSGHGQPRRALKALAYTNPSSRVSSRPSHNPSWCEFVGYTKNSVIRVGRRRRFSLVVGTLFYHLDGLQHPAQFTLANELTLRHCHTQPSTSKHMPRVVNIVIRSGAVGGKFHCHVGTVGVNWQQRAVGSDAE